jgi:hypothetical protein
VKPAIFIIAVALSFIGSSACADEATLAKAILAYNELPSSLRKISVEPVDAVPGDKTTRLPAWLTKVDLNDKEAAATAAAFGVYGDGFRANYRSRNWSRSAVAAGWVAETLSNSFKLSGGQSLPDAGSNLAPSRELIEARRRSLISAMNDMGTCSGALVRAAQKTAKVRTADDATRLLAKAKRDLGASVLPPDDSCLT